MTLFTLTAALFANDVQAAKVVEEPDDNQIIYKKNLHGFRLGYAYANGSELHPKVKTPHMFVMGYEFTQRLAGGEWLTVIAVENISLSGINQSLFIPTANVLVGFELNKMAQIGVGPNISPFDVNEKYVHMVAAGGFTANAGSFNVPIHAYYIPDVDGDWRAGLTTGVNW